MGFIDELPQSKPDGFASSLGGARPLRRSRARFPLLSPTVTSSPGAGEVFPLRESQAVKLIAKVLGAMRKFSAVLLPLPLGEVDLRSKDGEGAGQQGPREFIPHIFTHFLRYCINVCKIVSISRIIMHKY